MDVYLNGNYIKKCEATVSIDDRGFIFSDAVYEGLAIVDGTIIDLDLHIERLGGSLDFLQIRVGDFAREVHRITNKLIQRNNIVDGFLYLHITRGSAPRAHPFPSGVSATKLVVAQPFDFLSLLSSSLSGVKVVTYDDIRWNRCSIKSTSLQPNVLAAERASQHDAREAWFINANGNITEGASSNAFIVLSDGSLKTHPPSHNILSGITRNIVIDLAKSHGINVIEEAFGLNEALSATEAFYTNSLAWVMPVVEIDDGKIGNHQPGAVTKLLQSLYINQVAGQCDSPEKVLSKFNVALSEAKPLARELEIVD